jgi:hypothetical protein
MSQQSAGARSLDLINHWYDLGEAWLFEDKRALRGVALARILSGCSVLGILITNFRVRNLLFGQGSVWNKPLQDQAEYAPPHLVEHLGNTPFLFYYLGVILLATLWILGWHTRLVGPLLLVGEISLIERIPILGDQGDNILRIGLFLLMFMHTNEFWSLDARRRAKSEPEPIARRGRVNLVGILKNLWNSHYMVPRWLSNGVHNLFLAALMFQLIIIYISAGMFKTQGALWQHGTALYYPLQLQEYKPFPFLSDAMTHFGVFVGLATYVVVFTQLFFPLMLLHTITRRIAIALVILFHVSIAVVMALPWFSLSMIAFDAVWVSTATLVAVDGWLRDRLRPVADLFWDIADPVIDRVPGLSRAD